MQLNHHISFTNSYLFNSFPPFTNPSLSTSIFPLSSFSRSNSCRNFKIPKFRRTLVPLCTKNGVFEEFKDTHFPKRAENDEELEGLELLNKPSPKQVSDVEAVEEVKKVDADEFLAPFYKLFMAPEEEIDRIEGEIDKELGKIGVECYEPKQGDFVVGVVVSGNENKLDVNVGADMLGTMLTKEVLPLYDKEMGNLLCDVEKDAEEFLVHGKVGILRNDEVMGGAAMLGRPVVDVGTVLFGEVLGRTLGGRPLLSGRKLFRRIAWHRVRQVFFLLTCLLEWGFLNCVFDVFGFSVFVACLGWCIRRLGRKC